MQAYSKLSSKSAYSASWRSLIAFLAIAFAVALIGALITEPALHSWYAHLEKPSFTPRGWIFGAVWSFLYSSMAYAFWRVWNKRTQTNISVATILYHFQLLLNLGWTVAFFGMHQAGVAFADILFLQLANFATAISFYKVDKVSGFLFIPYIWWISFASILNFYIWIAN
jgi:tryptophan-rich sensory protein